MKRYAIFVCLLCLSANAWSADRLSLSGYLKNELAMRVEDHGNDVIKNKNILQLAGEYRISEDDLVFFMKARYWYDAMYDVRDKYDQGQDAMGHVQRTDWLRDCYFDYTRGPWFLRLGKQQVAWGQADGITILDRVNPVDLSEFWLQDFEDMRIPLWMANVNFSPKTNSNIQFLIIPDFEQSTSAPIGAPFTTYSYSRYEAWRIQQRNVDQNIYFPGTKLSHSTYAVQWSDRIGELSYTLNYLQGYYYSARNLLIYVSGNPNMPSTASWKVDRSFKRWQMYGLSYNTTLKNEGPLQGLTIRGDFAFYDDEPMYWGNPHTGSSSGIKRQDNVFWLIGLDKYVITNWLVSFQYAQYILQHAKPGAMIKEQNFFLNPFTYGAMDPLDHIFSIKISTDLMNERLKPEILWSFTDDNQGRVSPKLNFELRDNVMLTFGAHYFYGNLWDSNGQYRDMNEVYMNVKYSF